MKLFQNRNRELVIEFDDDFQKQDFLDALSGEDSKFKVENSEEHGGERVVILKSTGAGSHGFYIAAKGESAINFGDKTEGISKLLKAAGIKHQYVAGKHAIYFDKNIEVEPMAAPSSLPPVVASKKDDLRKGMIWMQAMMDALGLTTEFLPRVNAQDIKTKLELEKKNLDYSVRGNNGYYKGETSRFVWRNNPPKGAPTDDTDQAVLKSDALSEADKVPNCSSKAPIDSSEFKNFITEAQKRFAGKMKGWWNRSFEDDFQRPPFGLGANTSDVMQHKDFSQEPLKASKEVWKSTYIDNQYYPSANGALMSSSYIVNFFRDDLKKAQVAAEEMAKVTHYDPLVSAHCVAYTTMLWKLLNRQNDISDGDYKKLLDDSHAAAIEVFNRRKSEYDQTYLTKNIKLANGEVVKNEEFLKGQMGKAIYSDGFQQWKDLNLANNNGSKNLNTKTAERFSKYSSENYDNIGMSHRALSAGFYALKDLREKMKNPATSDKAVKQVCEDLVFEGGDADTNGTIVGSLIGVFCGYEKIAQSLPHLITGFRKEDGAMLENVYQGKEVTHNLTPSKSPSSATSAGRASSASAAADADEFVRW